MRSLFAEVPNIWHGLVYKDQFFERFAPNLIVCKYGQDVLLPIEQQNCARGLARAIGAAMDPLGCS